jgi:hypothetical protein
MDALAVVACIVLTTHEHPGAASIICPMSGATGSASAAIATDAESV